MPANIVASGKASRHERRAGQHVDQTLPGDEDPAADARGRDCTTMNACVARVPADPQYLCRFRHGDDGWIVVELIHSGDSFFGCWCADLFSRDAEPLASLPPRPLLTVADPAVERCRSASIIIRCFLTDSTDANDKCLLTLGETRFWVSPIRVPAARRPAPLPPPTIIRPLGSTFGWSERRGFSSRRHRSRGPRRID